MSSADRFEATINERSQLLGLAARTDNLVYFNGIQYGGLGPIGTALYVGIGHGLDALAALAAGHVERIVGVDPYIGTHGNDDSDLQDLLELAAHMGLADRAVVHRCTVQQYHELRPEVSPGCIVLNDVLHHIFETPARLSLSPHNREAIRMFAQLRSMASPSASMSIFDAERHGLRPLLNNLGVTKLDVDYQTKQPAADWIMAAQAGGWQNPRTFAYVPHRLRRWSAFAGSPPMRPLLADHYFCGLTATAGT